MLAVANTAFVYATLELSYVLARFLLYIGEMTLQYDFYVVGQHGVLRECDVKWSRFVALFE